jgi:hypothetical protein
MADQSDNTRPHRPDDATADDLVITDTAYVEEIHAALRRTEDAFTRGDYAAAAQLAAEGLETIRISTPHLGLDTIPGYYAAFFHSYQLHDEFRDALRLYKQGVTRHGGARQANVDRECLARARELLEPKAASLDDTLPVERLVFEFPVSGRLLRAVIRLRQILRGMLAEPPRRNG